MPSQTDAPASALRQILKQYWGFDTFRPLQEEIIRSILDGNDTLALMPTGGGKSVCYQVPGLAKDGLCLVISPLIALMKDQVEGLRKKNITAYSIYSGMSRKEVINTLKVASQSNCKFLYVSPERLETTLFREYLPGLDVNLIAVDEAHCISQWGYDFRPPYLRIALLREELPNIPVLALTASATPEVQQDICGQLRFRSLNILRQSFERPNLSYSVFKVDSRINKIVDVLTKVQGSAIVYCRSRKRTKEISDLVKMHGIAADFYHAGLNQEERNQRQEAWKEGQVRVIVCTNAFGMGIDKPDVRVVIHADAPDCLENYYQEAGRAGRDGKRAYAVFLYGEKDIRDLDDSVRLRYPSIDDIRSVYQAVSNYLQIPSGGGKGKYYDFDLTDFIKRFRLNSSTVLYSLKALEQDEWLSYNEQIFLPPTVRFSCRKDDLYEFEKHHQPFEPLVTTLLRAYEGIFEFAVPVSEVTMARLLNKEASEIKTQLEQLHRYQIIEYLPRKDAPQLLFLRDRARAEDVSIDLKAFNERKEKFTDRVKKMVHYLQESAECRSKMIASYFGDHTLGDCGICDNCLRRKSVHLSKEEFELINRRIVSSVGERSIHAKELLHHLTGIKREKAWTVIRFLQSENKIELDRGGWIRLK